VRNRAGQRGIRPFERLYHAGGWWRRRHGLGSIPTRICCWPRAVRRFFCLRRFGSGPPVPSAANKPRLEGRPRAIQLLGDIRRRGVRALAGVERGCRCVLGRQGQARFKVRCFSSKLLWARRLGGRYRFPLGLRRNARKTFSNGRFGFRSWQVKFAARRSAACRFGLPPLLVQNGRIWRGSKLRRRHRATWAA